MILRWCFSLIPLVFLLLKICVDFFNFSWVKCERNFLNLMWNVARLLTIVFLVFEKKSFFGFCFGDLGIIAFNLCSSLLCVLIVFFKTLNTLFPKWNSIKPRNLRPNSLAKCVIFWRILCCFLGYSNLMRGRIFSFVGLSTEEFHEHVKVVNELKYENQWCCPEQSNMQNTR